jgi:hypothetical protein
MAKKIREQLAKAIERNYSINFREDSPIDEQIKLEEEEEYLSNQNTEGISFVEMAIINSYLHSAFRNKPQEITVESYGEVDGIGRISFGGMFNNTGGYWFDTRFDGDDNHYKLQTCMFIDNRGDLVNQLSITGKTGLNTKKFEDIFKKIKSLAFNNSEYKGKCVKIRVKEGSFRGIEIINIEESKNELILNDIQIRYINHFISRVGRGGNARYLLNGEPGTGKTESIRAIGRALMPDVTFIIPEFRTTEDLTSIMEACEIFDNAVIIMDDVDLFLGSRDHGSYTSLLGQFLSFFDGVKKRNISLLASTNDKGLVDKAAERPGRFNFTLDYTFLDDEQIEKVCKIHLDEKWQISEVYDALKGRVDGKKAKITGAFIANLADNIREMSEDDPEWDIEDTISLIKESYKGFYSSQVEKNKDSIGFIN